MPGLTNKHTRSLLDDLAKQGATIQARAKSVWRITFPDGSVIVAHSTPSDLNWHRHLKRATEKAGLHWPLEDRAAMKRMIKEKEGRGRMTEFVTEYGAYNRDYISQESVDRVAAFLTGKGRTTSPQITAGTGLSSPTVTRSLLKLGWLQEKEKEKENFVDANGANKAKFNTFWSPAPESVLSAVSYRDTAPSQGKKKSSPKVTVTPKDVQDKRVGDIERAVQQTQDRTTEKIREASADAGFDTSEQPISAEDINKLRGGPVDLEQVIPQEPAFVPDERTVLSRDENEWFAEAERMERRALLAESRAADLDATIARLTERAAMLEDTILELRAADTSWPAPGVDDLPEGTTVADLFSTLRLMGLSPEIRLRRGAAA